MAKFEVISRGGSIGSHDPAVMGEHDTIEQAREHAKRLTKQLTPGERNYYKMGYLVREKKATDSTRKAPARLHRALDAILDARPARDAVTENQERAEMARLGGMARREAYWRELEKPENKNASPTKAAKLMGAKDRIPADCLDLGTLAL